MGRDGMQFPNLHQAPALCAKLNERQEFIMRFTFTTIFVFLLFPAISQDTLKVNFLYGSKPKWDYRDTEKSWFGGVLGGHVGIEGDSGKILNFINKGNFHVFSNKNNMH